CSPPEPAVALPPCVHSTQGIRGRTLMHDFVYISFACSLFVTVLALCFLTMVSLCNAYLVTKEAIEQGFNKDRIMCIGLFTLLVGFITPIACLMGVLGWQVMSSAM